MTKRIKRIDEYFVPVVFNREEAEWQRLGMNTADVFETEEAALKAIKAHVASEWDMSFKDAENQLKVGVPVFTRHSWWIDRATSDLPGRYYSFEYSREIGSGEFVDDIEIYAITSPVVG